MKYTLAKLSAIFCVLDLAIAQDTVSEEDRQQVQPVKPADDLEQPVFLAWTNTIEGSIEYMRVTEQPDRSLKADSEHFTLQEGFTQPTYTAYDFHQNQFYVCDRTQRAIKQFSIVFHGGDEVNEQPVKTSFTRQVLNNVQCGGLKTDKFSNLFFVDEENNFIGKINYDQLSQDQMIGNGVPVINLDFERVYDGRTSESVMYPKAIDIEREYLYWTNFNTTGIHGAVHKAFTEPFVRAEPFQSYEVYEDKSAVTITTNDHYLFFVGQRYHFRDEQLEQPLSEKLFVQKKKGATITTTFDEEKTDKIKGPKGIASFKDTLLLVANNGFISQLDIRHYPPTEDNFFEENLMQLAHMDHAPLGLTFFAQDDSIVNEKTLVSNSGAVFSSVATTAAALLLSMMTQF